MVVELVARNGVVGTVSVPTLPPLGYIIQGPKGEPMLVLGGVVGFDELPKVLVEYVQVHGELTATEVAFATAPSYLLDGAERARLLSIEREQMRKGFAELAEADYSDEPPQLPNSSV